MGVRGNYFLGFKRAILDGVKAHHRGGFIIKDPNVLKMIKNIIPSMRCVNFCLISFHVIFKSFRSYDFKI